MGVNTICKLLTDKDSKGIEKDFKRIKGLTNFEIDTKKPEYTTYKNESIYTGGVGYIKFEIMIKNKVYKFNSFVITENLDYSINSSTAPFINDKKFLYFSTGQSVDNIKILEYLSSYFGGYVIPVDTDEDDNGNAFYSKIKKTKKLEKVLKLKNNKSKLKNNNNNNDFNIVF